MTSARLKAYFYLTLVAVIWGAAGPIIKFTLAGIDPLTFLAYRFAISASFAIVYFLFRGIKLTRKLLPYVVLYGLLAFTLALGALFFGLDRSTVLDLTLIATAGPLIIIFGGALIYKDRITNREKLGIAIVLSGVLLNTFIPLFSNGGVRLTGNIFLLIFLLSDTSGVLLAKKAVQKKISPMTLTNAGFIVGALTLIPIAFYQKGATNIIQSVASLPFKYHLGVWYMALLSGTLAYFLWVKGQKSIEVSEAALFYYLQPIFAVPLAVFWLGEKITPIFTAGAVLIITGVIIAEYKKRRVNLSS